MRVDRCENPICRKANKNIPIIQLVKNEPMKKIILLANLVLLCVFAQAQSPIGANGKQLNFGTGFNTIGFPIYVGVDFGVHPDITLGPEVGVNLNFNYISFAGKGDYHFNTILNIPRDWDFYAGLNLGFVSHFHSRDHYNYTSGLSLGLQVGGRYYWNRNWGVNLEIGGANVWSGGRIGLSKRF